MPKEGRCKPWDSRHRGVARISVKGVLRTKKGMCPARGVWGHAPPENFEKLGALRAILGLFETISLLFSGNNS